MKSRTVKKKLASAAANGRSKTPQTRRPRRRRITATEKQQVTQMMRTRFPQAYAFSDRLAELKKDGVDPKRVREILVSPYTVLGPLHDLEKRLREAEDELQYARGFARDACQARITQIENELVIAAKTARLGHGQRFGRRKKGPSGQYWYKAPVEIPEEPWLNPRDWPWLRERAAELAAYLSTTRLPNPKRPHRFRTTGHPTKPGPGWHSKPVREVTAELIRLFYRWATSLSWSSRRTRTWPRRSSPTAPDRAFRLDPPKSSLRRNSQSS